MYAHARILKSYVCARELTVLKRNQIFVKISYRFFSDNIHGLRQNAPYRNFFHDFNTVQLKNYTKLIPPKQAAVLQEPAVFVTGYQTLNLFCVRDMAHTSRFPSKQSLRITAIHVLNTSREAVFALTKLRLKISERTLYRYYVVERGNLWFIQRTSQ